MIRDLKIMWKDGKVRGGNGPLAPLVSAPVVEGQLIKISISSNIYSAESVQCKWHLSYFTLTRSLPLIYANTHGSTEHKNVTKHQFTKTECTQLHTTECKYLTHTYNNTDTHTHTHSTQYLCTTPFQFPLPHYQHTKIGVIFTWWPTIYVVKKIHLQTGMSNF